MSDPGGAATAADNAQRANAHETSPFRRATTELITALMAESPEQATAQIERALEIAETLDNSPLYTSILGAAGIRAMRDGQPVVADLHAQRTIQFSRESGSLQQEAFGVGTLAWSHAVRFLPTAGALFHDANGLTWGLRDWGNCLQTVEHYGVWLAGGSRKDEATALLAYLAKHHFFFDPATAELVEELRTDSALADALARGAAMTRDEVVAYALSLTEDASE